RDLAADANLTIEASIATEDRAGNKATASTEHAYGADLEAPELAITLNGITEDNVINIDEAGRDITITGTITGEFNEGDTVTLTVNGKEFQGAVNAEGLF
ncbi:Ig-like domain-containing protein, partial [Legionella londiniensis]